MNELDLYLRVREKEGRIYSDAVLQSLPRLPSNHPLAAEWQLRAGSCAGLVRYLTNLNRPLNILELGSGNGWLSHQMVTIPSAHVLGVDRGGPELAQAARVFGQTHLEFTAADIFRAPFQAASFDIIVLASVIQYFPNLTDLILAIRPLLTAVGEIHLLDSPLYPPAELPSARERTQDYYRSLGFPEMASCYHHHATTVLDRFSPRWIYRPDRQMTRILGLLGRRKSPFPWIMLFRASLR